MKKQDVKKIWTGIFIVGIILAIILFSDLKSLHFFDQTLINRDSADIKYHYAGEVPLYGETCQPYNTQELGIFFGNERTIETGKSTFKFIVDDVNFYEAYEFTIKPSYSVRIYKDNILIDTIKAPPLAPLGTCYHGSFREQKFYRAYSDSGKVYIPDGDEITPIVYTNDLSASGCPPGTADFQYTKPPYGVNKITKIELPSGETGINVIFGLVKAQETVCHKRNVYVVNKYEIVRDACPSVIGWRVEDERCVEESGCDYDGSIHTYYNSFEECQKKIVIEPPKINPRGWIDWIFKLNEWITEFFKKIFGLSIVGKDLVEPNTIETYDINLISTPPDSDWSDGSYSVQYSNWALIDSENSIVQQGTWEETYGEYKKQVSITTPSDIGNYILIATITQYEMAYDFSNRLWNVEEERILTKEAIDVQTKYTVIEPEKPSPPSFADLINKIIDFIRSLWNALFG